MYKDHLTIVTADRRLEEFFQDWTEFTTHFWHRSVPFLHVRCITADLTFFRLTSYRLAVAIALG